MDVCKEEGYNSGDKAALIFLGEDSWSAMERNGELFVVLKVTEQIVFNLN